MSKKSLTTLINWLSEKSALVRRIEAKAQTALHKENDSQSYRQLMEEKATLLATLHEEALPLLAKLAAEKQERVGRDINRFSASASSALKIGSVFYMSALLYPEEHTPDAPNDLELFISKLEAQGE